MVTANKMIAIAQNELGYLEKNNSKNLYEKTANAGQNNFTKYWDVLNPDYQGEPWCQCFVNWVALAACGNEEEAKALLCQKKWDYYTPTCASAFQGAGQWVTDPKPGDIVYFKNEKRIHHVGIVTDVEADTIITVEGNTSSAAGVIPNGGGVFEKRYSKTSSKIAGYGRPKYAPETQYIHGWHKDEHGWWYAKDEHHYAHDEWMTVNHHHYYFDAAGYIVTGLVRINDKLYYFCESGDLEGALMKTGTHGELIEWYV